MLYEEINASCLIKVDVEGNTLLNATDSDVNLAGSSIHSAIHMAKHDMDCVAHTHTPAGNGGLGDGMRIAAAGADLDAVSPRRLS